MNNMINIKEFFDQNKLIFSTDKKGVRWLKRTLKPTTLRCLASNYLVDKKEIQSLFSKYLEDQEEIYNKRVIQAKRLAKKRIKNLNKEI